MASLSIGPVKKLVFVGGGRLLFQLAVWARDSGYVIKVITSQRHAEEAIGDEVNDSLINCINMENIECAITEDISSPRLVDFIGGMGDALALSFGAAWIIKKEVISGLFDNKLLNLHGTRLPQNRGGGGFTWQIMMGNRLGFCVIHVLDPGVDTGNIVDFDEFIYPPWCRTPADFNKVYQEKNYNFVTSFITRLKDNAVNINLISQPGYISTYWPRIHTPTHGWIDWSWTGSEIERFICAFDDPYPGAHTLLNGKLVKLKKTFASYQDGVFHPAQTGLVYRVSKNWVFVACRDGALVIEVVLDDGDKNIIDKIKVGDGFSTPFDKLGKNGERAIYLPTTSEPIFKNR